MKKFITMVLAIAMVITSVVVPTDKVKAAVAKDGDDIKSYTETYPDGSYAEFKERRHKGWHYVDFVYQAYYDANGNLTGLYEDGVWKKFTWDGNLTDSAKRFTIDDDGTWKEWDTKGNLIYQKNPDGTIVIDKRMKDEIYVDVGGGKGNYILVEEAYGKVDIMETFMVTEGFTSKRKLRCVGDRKVLNVKWSSSDPSIATVSKTGIVTGKKAGKVTVTATVIASGQQIKVPVKIVKNKCHGTTDCHGTKVSGSISYDKKGDLVCKFNIKNTTKKKLKYARKENILSFTISDGKHKNKSTRKRFGFTLKRGESKTVTIAIKKSKLKAKYNLPESDIGARLFIDAANHASVLTGMGLTVDGEFHYFDY